MAEFDAWVTFAVDNVINRIEEICLATCQATRVWRLSRTRANFALLASATSLDMQS